MLIKLDSWQLATTFSWYIVVYRIGCAPAGWSDACRSLGCDAFLRKPTAVSGLGWRRRRGDGDGVQRQSQCTQSVRISWAEQGHFWIWIGSQDRASTEHYSQNLQILSKRYCSKESKNLSYLFCTNQECEIVFALICLDWWWNNFSKAFEIVTR